MSLLRRFIASHCAPPLALGLGLLASTLPARAVAPHFSDTLPLSQVKPGMVGYGLTTFKGTTISRFEVTVIGILRKENAGHDLILIKMKGGPITERGANLIQGMSGSPIYLNGKVAGAFSMGEEFPKEPVGMVTPIDDMLEAWDPDIPQQPSYFLPADKNPPSPPKVPMVPVKATSLWAPDNRERVAVLPQPIQVGGRRISRLVLNARADDPRSSSNGVAVLHRATSLLSVTGIGSKDRAWLQKELDQRGYSITVAQAPIVGAGRAPGFKGAALKPGSAFGTFLATGDVQVGATGTITYRRGDRLLGFGHPLMSLGALEGAITSAYIIDIFSGLQISHHIAVAGPVIGTLMQDRNFSVSAELGRMPHLIPFDVVVRDASTHREQTFHSHLFQHPQFTALLLRMIAKQAIARVHEEPGDVMARVTTTVDADEVGSVTRANTVFDSEDIATSAIQDLSDITSVVSGNPFYPLAIKSAHMTVDIASGHNTATVERIFVNQGRYEPGDNLDVGVVLKPYRRDPITRTITLKIPEDTPTGRYQLMVRGGTASVMRIGPLVISSPQGADTQTPPVNVRQMVARLNEHETNTDMVARLVLNSIAPALEGEKLSQLPPNISALMRSERNSGVRLERDELHAVQSTDYVVSGVQQLLVTVVRKDTQEPIGGTGTTTAPGAMPANPSGTPNGKGGVGDSSPSSAASDSGSADEAAPAGLPGRWLSALKKPRLLDAAKDEPKKNGKNNDKKNPKTTDKTDAGTKPDAGTTDPGSATITPVKTDDSSDKPVGRQLQVWRQTGKGDFDPGKFTGTSVTDAGELRLTSTLRRMASTGETYIWSLVSDNKGTLYAGTGTSGKILKIDSQGNVSTFATLPVVQVQSLLLGKDGTLWAGSGVKGNLYKVEADGKFTLAASLPEKYILALAQDSKGAIYVGPGGSGTVYKLIPNVNADPNAPHYALTPYIKTPADHIMALTVDSKDNLYVGTGNDGILYKVTPEGKSSVLFDAKENSITGVAADDKGNVYAVTGPKGMIYRITPEGTGTVLFDKATTFFTTIKPGPNGTFYAASVNAIYHITPSTTDDPTQATVQPLDNPKEVDFLTLAVANDGSVYGGTGNVGEIYTSAGTGANHGARSGVFTSVVHDAHLLSRWGMARWTAQVPAGTRIRVETRTGNVSEPDSTWSDWAEVKTNGSSSEGSVTSPSARFIQYRITLEADNDKNLPLVRDLSIGYMTRNQAPHVVLLAPAGGERWAKTQTIRWSGDDPDHDTLTYELYFSTDAGASWKPLPVAIKPVTLPTTTTKGKTTVIDVAAATEPDSLAALEAKLKADKSIPDALKQLMLDSARKKLSDAGMGTLRDTTSRSWDTKILPDGTYWLKVVASDKVSNPTDALTGQVISEPFVIANALPTIEITNRKVNDGDHSVTIEGNVQQSLVAVTAVQYRVDKGDWIAAAPKDGLFDSSREDFTLQTSGLSSGKHTIEIKAFNAAGSTNSQMVDMTIP